MFRFINIFFKLLATNLIILRSQLLDKLINVQIWGFCTLVVTGYIMQASGLSAGFGIFQLAGVIATAGLFECYGSIAKIIMDFAGEQSIGYYLTLPARPGVIILSTACGYACIGTFLSLSMVLLGKIVFYSTFNLASIAWVKLIAITILSNLFYGLLAQAIAAHVGQVSKIGNVWSRFIFPLWFFGGFQFAWTTVFASSKLLGYAILANPIMFIMEGTRACIQGQEGFISWWICMGALGLFTIVTWFVTYNRMQKRLDFV